MTLKNNRAPLLSNIKLHVSFHHHMWFHTGVTVRKWLSWAVTSVTLTFDLWPWPFVWTSLLSLVTTPENFVMIRWWKHCQKGVTDRQTDGRTDTQTDWTIHRAAWSQLKISDPYIERVYSITAIRPTLMIMMMVRIIMTMMIITTAILSKVYWIIISYHIAHVQNLIPNVGILHQSIFR